MPHPPVVPLILLGAVLAAGCKPREGANPAAGKAEAGTAAGGIQGRKTPLEPLALGPLAEGNLQAVVDKLARAHYDPEALGLAELGFEAELVLAKKATSARGRGSWRKGGRPEVKLVAVTRAGKAEAAPSEPGVKTQIWESLRLQLQNLLEGLGRGFLSQRFADWRKLEGRASLKEGKLQLTFGDDGGTNEVTIGEGYRVERVVHRSVKRVNRTMTYELEEEGGRNRVIRAVFQVEIEAGADLPPRALQLLEAQQGQRYELRYATVGGFRLPVSLRKVNPKLGDELEVKLRYTGLR
jgi:hypothetical protein